MLYYVVDRLFYTSSVLRPEDVMNIFRNILEKGGYICYNKQNDASNMPKYLTIVQKA